ncbi:hypothetical protein [Paenibacillus rhizoplanae]|uniref:Uncharacterized protein n=1 Tax=Paenibacillus rhizoplanae TaxID=1917181 RepID=A0ABW5FGA8_9BACL
MSGKTLLFNGVSGSGKSTIIKTLADPKCKDALNRISPTNYRKGTTSTNVKYTFGKFDTLSIEKVKINDFEDEWFEHSTKIKIERTSNNQVLKMTDDRKSFFEKINSEFQNAHYIRTKDIDFEDPISREEVENNIKDMKVDEVLNLINKNKIDKYILLIEINVPILKDLGNIIKKHGLNELSVIDTKGIGQDDESRNLDFSSVDGIVFINDGSKLTDKYQNEIKEDFENYLKSTPIFISVRHSFDLPFESLSGFNNSLMAKENDKYYLDCLDKYCSNNNNSHYKDIKEILKNCGLYNNGFLRRIVDNYAFNALPQDYSKDGSMQGIYAEKTNDFYIAAVLQMVDRCLFAIDEYKKVYIQASEVLETQGQIINSHFTDVTTFGCEMVKQIEREDRLNAKILRAYPDQLGKYNWLQYAFSDDNYEKKRLRITLFNIVNMAIDYSLASLVDKSIITENIAEILSVYFSIELKNKSSQVSMGYYRLGIDNTGLKNAFNHLNTKEKKKEYLRFRWYYNAIDAVNSKDRCEASTLFELYLGLFSSLNLVKFDPKVLDEVMIVSN